MNRDSMFDRPEPRRRALGIGGALTVALSILGATPGEARADWSASGHRPSVAFAGGTAHTCALDDDGTVACWGSNSFGQLGDGSTGDHLTPTVLPSLGAVVSIAAGDAHTCALLYDGSVQCWGDNSVGQLGTGSYTASSVPVAVSGIGGSAMEAVAISAGGTHTCAALVDGTVKCWGGNDQGQIGDGTTTNRNAPVTISGVSNITQVAAGGEHTCAMDASGQLWCWGANGDGQLGDGTTTSRTAPVPVPNIARGAGPMAVTISAGRSHTCAVVMTSPELVFGAQPATNVDCWGANGRGQLGNGTTTSSTTPVQATGLANVKDVSAGGDHACALLAGGTVACWGEDTDGEAGNNTTGTYQATPVTVSSVTHARAVASGAFHACAVLGNGTASCWGNNLHGQIGDGTQAVRPTPVAVSGLAPVSNGPRVAAGTYHTCGLLAGGGVKCWGYNGYGEIGDGTTTQRDAPVPVSSVSNAVDVCAGGFHSCALIADGTAQCWGYNGYGEIGNGTTSNATSPVAVTGLSNAVSITCGEYHTCATIADGTARCWGYNAYGELGTNNTTQATTPAAVKYPSGTTFDMNRSLAAGGYHTCAVHGGTLVSCWGYNGYGEVGDGTTTTRLAPVTTTLAGGLTPKSLGLGVYHSCAVTASGTAQCWGYNGYGGLGDGTATDRWSPVNVLGMTGTTRPVTITAGTYYSCSLVANSTFQCWGFNQHGQLGDGTTTNASVPMTVSWLWYGMSLAAGGQQTCTILTDGTARCWGLGADGQLGDGGTSDSTIAVGVSSFP